MKEPALKPPQSSEVGRPHSGHGVVSRITACCKDGSDSHRWKTYVPYASQTQPGLEFFGHPDAESTRVAEFKYIFGWRIDVCRARFDDFIFDIVNIPADGQAFIR